MKPRSGADKDAAYEVIRAVVAVGCAGVRSIPVVPVAADRRAAVVTTDRAYANSYSHAKLRVGVACCKETN
jgi:hypothetical protein